MTYGNLRKRLTGLFAAAAMLLSIQIPVSASEPAETAEASEEIPSETAAYGDDYPEEYKNAAIDSVIDRWRFYNRECTSFTAWCLNSRNKIDFSNRYGGIRWGHAKNWGYTAQKLDITVDMNPAIGSVYWSNEGTYGHVAWVCDVNGDSVTIEEYNYPIAGTYNTRIVEADTATGYIHIQDMPVVVIGAEMSDGGPQTIPDGNYHIITAADSSMCLDIAGASLENKTNVQIHHSTEADSQIFTITYLGEDKGYKIINKYSGKSLDVAGASKIMGANVWQQEYYAPSEHTQHWVIKETDNGAYYTIQSRGSGFYLNVYNAKFTDGANVHIWEGDGSNAQKWNFVPVEEEKPNLPTADSLSGIEVKIGMKIYLSCDRNETVYYALINQKPDTQSHHYADSLLIENNLYNGDSIEGYCLIEYRRSFP